MPSSYPSAFDALSNPTASDNLDSVTVPHATQHANANDAIEAMQAELGTDPSGAAATVKARFEAIEANNWVTNARMADNAVGTAEIVDGAVNIAKLGAAAVTKNLLTVNQASLETDTTGWSVNQGCTIARSTAQAWAGSASLEVTCATDSFAILRTTAAMTVQPGRIYTGSFYVRSAAAARGVAVQIQWQTAGGSYISNSSSGYTTPTTSGWTRVIWTAVAPSTAGLALLMPIISAPSAGEVFYFDGLGFWEGAGGVWATGGERVDPSTLGYFWDESAGRRRFEWDTNNNRWQMTYGDTGWRDVSTAVTWLGTHHDAGTTPAMFTRRINNTVFMQVTWRVPNPAPVADGTLITNIPAGFRASGMNIVGPVINNSSYGGNSQGGFGLATSTLTTRGLVAGSLAGITASFMTTEAWPSSLPGSASGSIPT